MKKTLLAGAAAICMMTGIQASARAAVYDFTYTGSGGSDSASGTLTTGTASVHNLFGTGYQITEITGSYNGSAITRLLPVNSYYAPFGPSPSMANDNILYTPRKSIRHQDNSGPYLDFDGLAFTTASGKDVNIYFNFINYSDIAGSSLTEGDLISLGDFGVTPASTPVPMPEPGSLVLLGTALFGVAFAARRKKT